MAITTRRNGVKLARFEQIAVAVRPSRRILSCQASESCHGCAGQGVSVSYWGIHEKALSIAIASLCLVAPSLAGRGGSQGIPCRYEVELLLQVGVTCFGDPPALIPRGMSESGIVTGGYNQCATTNQNSFVWRGSGPIVTLQAPPGVVDVDALDVNDAGQVVGQHSNTTTGLGFTGFLWNKGVWTDLGVPSWGTQSQAAAINIQGVIAGWVGNNLTGPFHAVLWKEGQLIDLHGAITAAEDSRAQDISDNGFVTGWAGTGLTIDARAFSWHGKDIVMLEPVPGGFTSDGIAINSHGHIAGHGRIPVKGGFPTTRAFFWDGSRMRIIEGIPNVFRSDVVAMNDSDVVVGEFEVPTGGGAFVWHDGVMRDLQELIDTPGVVIHDSAGINNDGVILCKGHLNGSSRTFKLIPVQSAIADLTSDCQVDGMDLNLLLTEWAKTESSADLNKDNTVNGIDLGILLSQWSVTS